MKLIITRHAKSSWDDLMLDDHDRPLNERGRDAAKRMGEWIAKRRHVPQHVMSSDAARAKETAELMIDAMGGSTLTLDEGLYHASADTLLARIQRAPKGDLMIVGHNPGIGEFASKIVDARPSHERFGVFPTTATLIADVPVEDWSQLRFGSARVIQFIVPRELYELNSA